MDLTEWEVIDYWDNRSVVMASNGQAAAEMVAGEPVSSVDARADGWTQYSTPYGFKAVKTKPVSTPAPAVVAGGDEALRAVRGVIQTQEPAEVLVRRMRDDEAADLLSLHGAAGRSVVGTQVGLDVCTNQQREPLNTTKSPWTYAKAWLRSVGVALPGLYLVAERRDVWADVRADVESGGRCTLVAGQTGPRLWIEAADGSGCDD